MFLDSVLLLFQLFILSYSFPVNLYELKTYHEVIDEIYYKVQHMEPWEKGSRKTAGQTGMCGGVSILITFILMATIIDKVSVARIVSFGQA